MAQENINLAAHLNQLPVTDQSNPNLPLIGAMTDPGLVQLSGDAGQFAKDRVVAHSLAAADSIDEAAEAAAKFVGQRKLLNDPEAVQQFNESHPHYVIVKIPGR